MALKDYADSHVAVAVAATAVVCSPRMREVLRRGAVYGVAGALMAGDAVASFGRGVRRGAQEAAASAPTVMEATEATVDGTDARTAEAKMDDSGSTAAPAEGHAQAGNEAGSSATEAPAEGGNRSAEVNGDE